MAYANLVNTYSGMFVGTVKTQIIELPEMTPGDLLIKAFKDSAGIPDLFENISINAVPDIKVKIELRLNEKVMASGSSTLAYKVTERSKGWTLKLSKVAGETQTGHKTLVQYPSTNPILTRPVPLAFFKRVFDEFWNKREPQPLSFVSGAENNQILMRFANDIADVQNLKPVPLNLGNIEVAKIGLSIKGVKSKKINFRIDEGALPVITVEAGFENIHIEAFDAKIITLEKPVFRMSFNLEARSGNLFFANTTAKMSGHISILGTWPDELGDDTIRDTIESKFVKSLNTAFDNPKIGKNIVPWLLGGHYTVRKLKCSGGNMLIEYIGPPDNITMAAIDPGSPGRADVPQPPENLKKIDHIVVLMMENRSFDHMLGYLKKDAGRMEVDGLTGDEQNKYKGKVYKVNRVRDTKIEQSPCHGFECVANQMRENMGGFVANFAERYEQSGAKLDLVMSYYGKEEVPVYDYLARQYGICDRWFCAHPGPTWCNRFITFTGKLNEDEFGQPERDNPEIKTFTPLETMSVFEDLTNHGVGWKVFEHGYSFIRLFTRYTFDTSNVISANDPVKGFFASAQQGKLPAVTFLEPDFIDFPPGNDDHPPADISHGQAFVAKVVEALEKSPNWNKTLLIITYDEHGGFYDHVLPPKDAPAISGITQYGPRVPAFIVSPYVKKGAVAKEVFDHTSILATICRRFLPPKSLAKFGERAKKANDAGLLLTEKTARPHTKIDVAVAPKPLLKAIKKPVLLPNPGSRDFHELLFFARLLLGYPPQ